MSDEKKISALEDFAGGGSDSSDSESESAASGRGEEPDEPWRDERFERLSVFGLTRKHLCAF